MLNVVITYWSCKYLQWRCVIIKLGRVAPSGCVQAESRVSKRRQVRVERTIEIEKKGQRQSGNERVIYMGRWKRGQESTPLLLRCLQRPAKILATRPSIMQSQFNSSKLRHTYVNLTPHWEKEIRRAWNRGEQIKEGQGGARTGQKWGTLICNDFALVSEFKCCFKDFLRGMEITV